MKKMQELNRYSKTAVIERFLILVLEDGEEGDVGGDTVDGKVVDAMGEAEKWRNEK